MIIDAAPFILGLITILGQPLLDSVWQSNFREKMNRDPERSGAPWAASIASFVPSATLTLAGALLLLDKRSSRGHAAILLVALVGELAIYGLYLLVGSRSSPGDAPRVWIPALLWLVVLLNVAGIVIVYR